MSTYPDPSSQSAQLFERAKHVFPDGSTRRTVFFDPYPLYAVSGRGCMVTDADGIERIDFINNYSSMIHGHSHPKIVEALVQQAGKLMAVGMPTESDIELAELLVHRLPTVERLQFCNSGTEAVMLAIKAARAYTERPKVARVEGAYHGAYDFDAVMLPCNDVERALQVLDTHKAELAGAIFDPIVGRLGFAELTPEYIRALRNWTRKNNKLLIIDEVFSFRIDYHGAQARYKVEADLTALGKIIGGGIPIGALGGRKDVMSVFGDGSAHPKLHHHGTYNANPLAMTAGRVSMEMLTSSEIVRINTLGERLMRGIEKVLKDADAPARAQGVGSMVAIAPINTAFTDRVHREMLSRGVLMMARGAFVISTPMREAEIDRTVNALAESLQAVPVR